MGTLTAGLIAVVVFILSLFGVHTWGKSKGKAEQKTADDKKAAEQETAILKADAEAKTKSEEISKTVNDDISNMGSGDALEWLRKNADRNKHD